MAVFVRKINTSNILRPFCSGDGEDNSQKERNNLHSYETVDDPSSLVKTTIVRRNAVLQQPKTPEQIPDEAAQNITKRKPEEGNSKQVLETGLSERDAKSVYWGQDGHGKSLVGYDSFQELQEIVSQHEK
ncbi:hypothetical protein pipiens_014072 [Culex pipiens pipiens]|uniref:Uncharacterized protein n=1 Tax=Culex pipiens pipiens TaxID=38569 RepID=A0ABD1CVX5_CULPP